MIDVTHNVPVPFEPNRLGGGWGILNPAAAAGTGSFDKRLELTTTDFGCIEPLRTVYATTISCGPAGDNYGLSQTAQLGPIACFSGGLANAQTVPASSEQGFAIYVAGETFMFALPVLPPAGTVWTLREYIGAISGGHGAAGHQGAYSFRTPEPWRTLSAVGAQIQVSFDVTNQVAPPADSMLANVHTVPDPYYVTDQYEQTTLDKVLKFVNLPDHATIRIYSSSGIMVTQLENPSADCQNASGTTLIELNASECTWNLRNRNNQVVAGGVYFYHIESGKARKIGRFTVVNFAPDWPGSSW